MTPTEFDKELAHIGLDSMRERQVQDERPMSLGLEEIKNAFAALQRHAMDEGDLFIETDAATDNALLLIFAFLVLP